MLQNVSYETLQTVSVILYVTAGILLLVSVPLWFSAFGGINGIKRRLKGQNVKLAADSVSVDNGDAETGRIEQTEKGAPGSEETSLLVQEKEPETELLKNPVPQQKFRVTRDITLTHDQEAVSDQ